MNELENLVYQYSGQYTYLHDKLCETEGKYMRDYYALCRKILEKNGFFVSVMADETTPILSEDASQEEINDLLHSLTHVCEKGFYWNFLFTGALEYSILKPSHPVI